MTGRNFGEALRVFDGLRLTGSHEVAAPVNWQAGNRAIIAPSVTDEPARERFPQGWEAQKPYLRWVDAKGA